MTGQARYTPRVALEECFEAGGSWSEVIEATIELRQCGGETAPVC